MTSLANQYDAVIVGAGMAGASLGAELAGHMSVLVVEAEEQPGYHATGRSVAFWSESYGGPYVRPLTRASYLLLAAPDRDFAEQSFLTPRGALHIGRAQDAPLRDAKITAFADDALFTAVDGPVLGATIPGLRDDWILGLEEPTTCDIDVAALHGAYLRRLRQRGGIVACSIRFEGAQSLGEGRGWALRLSAGEEVRTPLLINAAGAWADDVARTSGVNPLGITPLLRTVAQIRISATVEDDIPIVLDLAETFYFKAIGGRRIWLTPHDEQPAEPGDVAPDELDVAIAIDRLEQAVDWRVEAVERRWAGLRSFSPDRRPVYGPDRHAPDFFWFAGQGGFGIQTAPAAARLGAALILGRDDALIASLDTKIYAPARF